MIGGIFPPFPTMKKRFMVFTLLCLVIFLDGGIVRATGDANLNVDVNVDSGPEFTGDDKDNIMSCMASSLNSHFPFDIYRVLDEKTGGPDATNTLECPKITIFYNDYEACYLLDILKVLEPFIVL
jgi:hypothetical protein